MRTLRFLCLSLFLVPLLAFAQQRSHVHAQMLPQQIEQGGFNPGNNVNCGS